MPGELQQYLLVWMLVLTRLSLVLTTAPGLGAGVPTRVRALFAMGLAAFFTPLLHQVDLSLITGILPLAVAIAREALVGLLIGFVVQLLITGMQTAGELANSSGGLQVGDTYDPQAKTNVPVISRMIGLLSMAILLATGGHRQLISALLSSFATMPLGRLDLGEGYLELITQEIMIGLTVGIRASAPLLVAVLLANLITGLLSRTLPQLNLMAVGWNINTVVVLLVIAVSITGLGTIFENEASAMFARLEEWIGSQKFQVGRQPLFPDSLSYDSEVTNPSGL
jgi:flagellar biosynthetic protein FliR